LREIGAGLPVILHLTQGKSDILHLNYINRQSIHPGVGAVGNITFTAISFKTKNKACSLRW
jgi:hypothetical protein